MPRLTLHNDAGSLIGTTRTASLCAFDIARLAAVSLVALQHLLTISGLHPPLLFNCLNVGQLGVTIFCGMSGYFSLRSSQKNALQWISRRLARIYIPYWIALSAILVANEVVRYKPASIALIVSEYLGTALFTHPNAMVGVHVWFISLILMCYAIAMVLRWKPAALPLFAIAAVMALYHEMSIGAEHILSFLAGCCLAKCGGWKQRLPMAAMVVGLGAAGFGWVDACFAYPLAAIVVLLVCNITTALSPAWLSSASESTYEYFLVHGPIYLCLAKYAHFNVFANALVGTPLAILATILLRVAAVAVSNLCGSIYKHYCLQKMKSPASTNN
jgi:hypothetical protein